MKKRKPSLEVLRQRRVAFYGGISRDVLRDAARRADEGPKLSDPADSTKPADPAADGEPPHSAATGDK